MQERSHADKAFRGIYVRVLTLPHYHTHTSTVCRVEGPVGGEVEEVARARPVDCSRSGVASVGPWSEGVM